MWMPVVGSHLRAAVIPAKAGIHSEIPANELHAKWIPAFAGMTGVWKCYPCATLNTGGSLLTGRFGKMGVEEEDCHEHLGGNPTLLR
jgi:FMN-dependent NADH-azoreductase